ncbi:MAG TPA: alpha/beta fold hydrolase [Thermomicrobiales bacterium]|nr:alpha/beta fold hydrolase [Thermomicrobiales bacterium]
MMTRLRSRLPAHAIRFFVLAALLILTPVASLAQEATPAAPTQPGQPTSGPGGSDYRYDGVEERHVGETPRDAWVFTPEGVAEDELGTLDVVILIHGFGGIDPGMYEDWIRHLVRRGAIVIFPVYQSLDLLTVGPSTWPGNLFAGIRTAVTSLSERAGTDFRTKPVDVIGHSLGGPLAIRYTLDARRLNFPEPRTLFVVQPGGCQPCGNFGNLGIDLPLDEPLPSTLLAQVLVGDRDETVGDADARSMWPLFDAIPPGHKDYVTIRSDEHGTPPVIADHAAVGTGNRPDGIDVIDWFALWRSQDALMSCAASGTDCAYALGDTPEHRSMGTWSDGVPITPLLITDGPPT